MTHGEAWLRGWRKAFDFTGSAGRQEFCSFFMASVVICLLPLLLWFLVTLAEPKYGVFIFFAVPVAAILALVFAIPMLAVCVRRMHDIGYSGWWLGMVIFIPFALIVILAVCCLKPTRVSAPVPPSFH